MSEFDFYFKLVDMPATPNEPLIIKLAGNEIYRSTKNVVCCAILFFF